MLRMSTSFCFLNIIPSCYVQNWMRTYHDGSFPLCSSFYLFMSGVSETKAQERKNWT